MDIAGIIEGSLDFIYNGFRAWRGFRLLAFGTTCVGKTTLWQYLEKGKLVESTSLERTEFLTPIGGPKGKFRMRDIKMSGIKVAVRAVDMPGQLELRETWKEVLYAQKPHGIIFMIDNVKDTNEGIPSVGYDQSRLDEHYQAFEYLRDLILDNEDVVDTLQAFLILVNKNDSFPENLRFGDIIGASKIDNLYPRFQEIPKLRMRALSCSALYGHNIQEGLKWMVKNI